MSRQSTPAYLDVKQSLAARVQDLVGRLTLKEKIAQLMHEAPAVERVGLPAYNYWNEALHGVARAGRATVFPQAIGLAATFDAPLLEQVGAVIATEGRAKHHAAAARGYRSIYLGLTFWSPNINIFRDPRWGRGHETYGEDPYLTARLGVAFIRGIQGDHAHYLKAAACAKHFAVHSGPETERHGFDAVVSPKDLRETYLYAFEAAVREAKVEVVMGAYNRTNGEACCASPTLLGKILREEWGFDGHVVSDCGAIDDIHKHHKVTPTPEASAAAGVKQGCDLNCGCTYASLVEAVQQGLISEAEIDRALSRVLRTRFRLGMFDPPTRVPFARPKANVVSCAAHRELARQAARESIVLLKNANHLLPLRRDLNCVLVTGPNAANMDVLLGNYNGLSGALSTPLEGIVGQLDAGTKANYVEGCPLTGTNKNGFGVAGWYGKEADVIVAVMGLSPRLEGEEGDAAESDSGGDRKHINLPGVQEEFLKHLKQTTGKPVVLVLANGSAVAANWAAENVDAILTMWYPGEAGGLALGDVLFGDYNPGGRLPVTFYRDIAQLPPFRDYAMAGRTYRYFAGDPLYPFGFGLSYTRFEYREARLRVETVKAGEPVDVAVVVHNAGDRPGDEVVQLYVSALDAPAPAPHCQLRGFRRVHLMPGEEHTVLFTLTPDLLATVGADGQRRLLPGRYRVTVGGCSPGARAEALGAATPAVVEFSVVG